MSIKKEGTDAGEAGAGQSNEKASTWTVTATLTVFAGDMSKEDVMASAEKVLIDVTDGSDIAGCSVIDVVRDEI